MSDTNPIRSASSTDLPPDGELNGKPTWQGEPHPPPREDYMGNPVGTSYGRPLMPWEPGYDPSSATTTPSPAPSPSLVPQNILSTIESEIPNIVAEILSGNTPAQNPSPTPAPVPIPSPTPAVVPLPVPTAISGLVAQLEADALKSAEGLLAQMLSDASPALEQMLVAYATKYIEGVVVGHLPAALAAPQQLSAKPTIQTSPVVVSSHPAVNAATTTMLKGLSIDTVAAVANVLGTFTGIDFFSKAGWAVIGGLVGKTVIQTVWKFFSVKKVT